MTVEPIPPDVFLASYPDGIREAADRLRTLVQRAVPDAIERVRPGWRLIGYDVPAGRRAVYFAFVVPEPKHVHLGFEHGIAMADPDRVLRGAHLKLRKVRYLTFRPGDAIHEGMILDLVQEAVRVATMSRAERLALLLDRD